MKKIVIAVVILILIGAGVFIFYKSKDNGVKFKTARITNGSLRATVTATGTMNAVKTVLVGTQVSGTLKELYVDFNSRVRKDQVIAEIDPATFQAQVDQARANVLAAKANVEKAQAGLTDSKRIRDQNRQLYSRNLIAKSDLDASEATYDSNKAQLSGAVAQVAQTEAALRFAETNLKYTKIASPVDGIVVSRNVDVGQTVAASFQTPTLFNIAQDLTKMQIDTNVDEADIGNIAVDQNVEFTVDAYPDSTFHGRVEQIRIAPITVQNVVTYDVVVRVDNTDMKLKPGMTANVSVIVAGRDNVLKIPNAALRFKPSEKDGISSVAGPSDKTGPSAGASDKTGGRPSGQSGKESQRPAGAQSGKTGGGPSAAPGKEAIRPVGQKSYAIWILENDKAKRVPVSIGISDGSFTEITAGDVKEGQEVIVESTAKTTKTNSGTQSAPRFIR